MGACDDYFSQWRGEPLAKRRFFPHGDEVVPRAPGILMRAWCGKRSGTEQVAARPGCESIPAILHGDLYEIRSPIIQQPAPAVPLERRDALYRVINDGALRDDCHQLRVCGAVGVGFTTRHVLIGLSHLAQQRDLPLNANVFAFDCQPVAGRNGGVARHCELIG